MRLNTFFFGACALDLFTTPSDHKPPQSPTYLLLLSCYRQPHQPIFFDVLLDPGSQSNHPRNPEFQFPSPPLSPLSMFLRSLATASQKRLTSQQPLLFTVDSSKRLISSSKPQTTPFWNTLQPVRQPFLAFPKAQIYTHNYTKLGQLRKSPSVFQSTQRCMFLFDFTFCSTPFGFFTFIGFSPFPASFSFAISYVSF